MIDPAIPVEPLDLIAQLLRPYSNQKIFMAIKFAARLDYSRLQFALQITVQQNPILGYRLISDGGRIGWAPSEIHPIALKPSDSCDVPVGNKIPYLLDVLSQGDQSIRVGVFRERDGDSLVVSLDHAVADAAGTKETCYQLAENYTWPCRAQAPPGICRRPAERSFDIIKNNLTVPQILRALAALRMPAGEWQFAAGVDNEPPCINYLIRHLPTDSISALKRRYANTGTTVNDILLGAFFNAPGLRELAPPGQAMPLQFTVDLRNYLPEHLRRRIANLSSVDHVRMRRYSKSRLDDLIKQAHESLRKIKRHGPGLGTALVSNMALRFGITRVRKLFAGSMHRAISSGRINPVLSNFGTIDEQRLVFGDTPVAHAFMTGPTICAPGLMLVASGYRGRLTLSLGSNKRQANAPQLPKVLEGVCTELQSLG